MIRINLLQERKVKKVDKGQKSIMSGFVVALVAGFAVYFFVHKPVADDVESMQADVREKDRQKRQLMEETKEFDIIKQQFAVALEQGEAIRRLNDARAVPAWLLHELSNIMTKDHKPTITADMQELVKIDHNRQWTPGWDPKRIWIESIDETGTGEFSIQGGAQSETDVTQLALRLQASVFFRNLVPEGAQRQLDPRTKSSFYKFTMTGKVAY